MAQLGKLAQTQTKRDRAMRVLAYIFQLRIEPRYTRTLHLAAPGADRLIERSARGRVLRDNAPWSVTDISDRDT